MKAQQTERGAVSRAIHIKQQLLGIVSALLLTGFCVPVFAATLFVEKWGDDANACTKLEPCLTIQHAIDTGGANARVIVGPGAYEEALEIINEGVTLESTAGQHETIVGSTQTYDNRADDPLYNKTILAIKASRVRFGRKARGFTVRTSSAGNSITIEADCPDSPPDQTCLGHITLEGNYVNRGRSGAIFAYNVDRLLVQQNRALGAVLCVNCTRGRIQNNVIGGGRLVVWESSYMEVKSNKIRGDGIELRRVIQSQLSDNVITEGHPGILCGHCEHLTILRNIVKNDGHINHGIRLGFNKSISVVGNLVSGNSIGFQVVRNTGVRFLLNSVSTSGRGIASSSNTYTSFIGNNVSSSTDCGIRTDDDLVYVRQFFADNAGGDICGDGTTMGTTRPTPNPLLVNAATRL